MRKVFNDCCMKSVLEDVSNCDNSHFLDCVDLSISNFYTQWRENTKVKSSLLYYTEMKDRPSLENYLLSNLDFYAASLKFKARSHTLPINGRSHHWNKEQNSICSLCKSGEEDLPHFLFNCEKLQSIRLIEMNKLENSLCSNQLDIFWHIFV